MDSVNHPNFFHQRLFGMEKSQPLRIGMTVRTARREQRAHLRFEKLRCPDGHVAVVGPDGFFVDEKICQRLKISQQRLQFRDFSADNCEASPGYIRSVDADFDDGTFSGLLPLRQFLAGLRVWFVKWFAFGDGQ